MPQAVETAVTIRLSRALTDYWAGPPSVDVKAGSLAEAFAALDARVPGLAARVLDDQGRIRQHVAIFVNNDYVREKDPEGITLKHGDRVHVVPSVSGG